MGYAEQARISEQHRLAQARLQALVVQDIARIYPLLDVNNVDRTFGPFFELALQAITARRTISASLGATYYNSIRADYDLPDRFTPILDAVPDPDRVFTSLLVTGPVAMKKNMASGVEPLRARDAALQTMAKAAQRHVIDGGRQTVMKSVRRDPRAAGWARLTDGKPCAFCALLASRGPAYRSEQTSKFKAHDGCGCTAVPVFDRNAPWPGRAEEFRKEYDENISGRFAGGDGNNEAVRAWRKHYDVAFEETAEKASARVASELVDKATVVEPKLTQIVQDQAARTGGTVEGLEYRLKTKESLTRKILGDVEESKGLLTADQVGAKMFDVNRYTINFADDVYGERAQDVIDDLRRAGNQLKVKNYWNVADNPYQGINVQVTTPLGEQFELQFHTSKSLEVKVGPLHEIYEKRRVTKDVELIRQYDLESFEVAATIPIPRNVGVVG